MEIKEFLSKSGVPFEIHQHTPVFTTQRMAAVEHERGRYVAKPVIVKADGRYLMCVLPASQHLDLAKLKTHLAARSVELAKESEIADLFPGLPSRGGAAVRQSVRPAHVDGQSTGAEMTTSCSRRAPTKKRSG